MTFRLRSDKVCKNRHHVIAKLQNSIRHSGDEKGLELNALVYSFSKTLINRYGVLYNVQNRRVPGRRFRLGNCYSNAVEMSQNQEYKYVEGIAVCKTSGVAICHAWNIDKNERAIDVTYVDTDNYDYYGIEISFEQIRKIGRMNGGIWFCSLPYLKK